MKYVQLHLDDHVPIRQVERAYGIENTLVSSQVERYLQDGEDAPEPHNGNPYVALHRNKSLSEVEHLRLLVAKQEVEIVRLKRISGGRNWYKQGVRYWQRKSYEVLEALNVKYPIDFLCRVIGINRSGYYKWKAQQAKSNWYERDRLVLTQLLREERKLHPSL